jgi:FtsH-binding integral membrane protein
MKNSQHLSNNLAGALLISVVFLVITLALDRVHPHPATRYVFTLFCVLGLASLAGWTWLSVKAITPKD